MHQAVIYIDPTGPAPVGFSQAAGMPGDIRFDFKTQANIAYPNVASLYPQLVLRPFSEFGVKVFDIEINDPTGASGIARVPGVEMNDKFHVEVYSRSENGTPQRMLAVGRLELNGYSYGKSGPLGPASYPEGPAGPVGAVGPQGPTGEQGVRGSRWYTGAGDPVAIPDVRVLGDMYLDEDTGAVWRWDGAAWAGYSANKA
jgi:hypothetical protein